MTFYLGGGVGYDKDILTEISNVCKCVTTDKLRQKVLVCFTLEVMSGVTKISSRVYNCVTRQAETKSSCMLYLAGGERCDKRYSHWCTTVLQTG